MNSPACDTVFSPGAGPLSAAWESWRQLNLALLRWLQAHARIWLCVLAAVMLLPATGTLPLMDRDEPRFARATVEMMQRGDAVIPWFNGKIRFDKPPLTYWWMSLHYLLLGPTELGARLHSVLAALGVALLLHAMGSRMFSPAAGFWAGAAWLTSFQVLAHGRLCVADMPMILAVTAAMWGLYELLQAEPQGGETRPFWKKPWFWLLAVSLGLGFLAKGPIALLVPLLALVIFRWPIWRRRIGIHWAWLGAALGIALIMVAAWGIPALIQSRGEFWAQGIGKHVVDRGVESFNGRVPLPFFYLATAFLSLLPWLGRAGLAAAQTRRRWDFPRAFLLSWLVAPYLIFSFYATQLPHYVLPGLGAFFLLLFQDAKEGEFPCPFAGKASACWFGGVHVFWLLLFGGLTALTTFAHWPQPLSAVQEPVRLLMLLMCVLQVMAILMYFGQLVPALGCVLVCSLFLGQIGREARASNPALQVQKSLAGSGLGQGSRLKVSGKENARPEFLAVRFTEPSLVFYQEGHWTFASTPAKAEKELKKLRKKGRGPVAVVMLEKEWTLEDHLGALLRLGPAGASLPPTDDYSGEVRQMAAQLQPASVKRFAGFNNGRTSWCSLVLMELPATVVELEMDRP